MAPITGRTWIKMYRVAGISRSAEFMKYSKTGVVSTCSEDYNGFSFM